MSFTETTVQSWVGPAYAAYALSDGPRFCNVNSSGQIQRNSSAGGLCDGVSPGGSAAQGDHISLDYSGHVEVTAGASVTVGDYIMSDNAGRGVTATSGNKVLGKCVKGASNAGEYIEVLLGVTQHQVA